MLEDVLETAFRRFLAALWHATWSPEANQNEVQIVFKIMKKNKVFINDLHAFVTPRMMELQRPNNVHFTEFGSRELAKEVVKSILRNLKNILND